MYLGYRNQQRNSIGTNEVQSCLLIMNTLYDPNVTIFIGFVLY